MMHRYPRIALAAMLLVPAILAGCSETSPVEPATNDAQYFTQVVRGEDLDTRDLVTSDVDALDETPSFLGKELAFRQEAITTDTITPLSYGRKITRVTRSVLRPAAMQGDSIAIVGMETVIEGDFVIRAMTPSGRVTIRKPFTETLHRNLRFERRWEDKHDDDEDDDDDHRRFPAFKWKLAAASIINGGTTPAGPAIVSIELITPRDTFLVTDPDAYFMAVKHPWKIKMPKLKNVPITVRVAVAATGPDTAIVTLHHLESDKGLRKKELSFVSEGTAGGQSVRIYEQTWTSKIKAKKKYGHLVISAIPSAAVRTGDSTRYASTIWGIPYLPNE